jgi:hypothetical protein
MKHKLFFFIIILSISFGCRSKKTVTEIKEVIKKDTLIITKDRYITKQFTDTLFVDNPCDSITGDLKDFQRTINTTNAKIDLSSVKGKIRLATNIDSVLQERIKEYKSKFDTKTEIKEVEVIKYRTPFNYWVVLVLSLALNFYLIFKRK